MKTAYPQIKGTCSIRLYSNIPFDNTYQHHTLISREFKYNNINIYSPSATDIAFGLPKERFINRYKNATTLYYPRYDLTGDFNFDFSNGLIASVVLELTPAQTNANYLRLTCGDDVYYYFITGIQQINYETYKLSLELDVLMTYQDEFLEGMKDVPVFTERKHCHRYVKSGITLYPKCCDFKNNDDAFSGAKPSIVNNITRLSFDGTKQKLNNVLWAYICYESNPSHTLINGLATGDMLIYCVPINASIRFVDSDNDLTISLEPFGAWNFTTDGKVHGVKISPYPPFYGDDIVVTTLDTNSYIIHSSNINISTSGVGVDEVRTGILSNDFCTLRFKQKFRNWNGIEDMFITINGINNPKYEFNSISLNFGITQPTINSERIDDARLLFEPFTKYTLASPYGQEYEFYPELRYSDYFVDTSMFTFESVATPYIGDNTLSTYLKPQYSISHNLTMDKYAELNIGHSCLVNYNIVVGVDALKVFDSTQAQAYYQSKTASGITSGITIAGGVATTALGVGLLATGAGAGLGVATLTGGVTALSSGVASAVNVSKSVTAKIEDLRNTPDSFNVSGNNIYADKTRCGYMLPYVVKYKCCESVLKNANDVFYKYGYGIARNCYFNTELQFDNGVDRQTDDNIFTRNIFNYVKISEDITNKINADMPLVAKQKLSSIFNNGITLWSFFGNTSLWSLLSTPDSNTNPDKWFMKDTYENVEMNF